MSAEMFGVASVAVLSPETSAAAKRASASSAAAKGVDAAPQPTSAEEVEAAVRSAAKQIDSYLKSVGRAVEFRVDKSTGTTVVTVRETATGDVIRQIPSEEVLQLARHLSATGSLIDLIV